jgi:hypothetical protein
MDLDGLDGLGWKDLDGDTVLRGLLCREMSDTTRKEENKKKTWVG